MYNVAVISLAFEFVWGGEVYECCLVTYMDSEDATIKRGKWKVRFVPELGECPRESPVFAIFVAVPG